MTKKTQIKALRSRLTQTRLARASAKNFALPLGSTFAKMGATKTEKKAIEGRAKKIVKRLDNSIKADQKKLKKLMR